MQRTDFALGENSLYSVKGGPSARRRDATRRKATKRHTRRAPNPRSGAPLERSAQDRRRPDALAWTVRGARQRLRGREGVQRPRGDPPDRRGRRADRAQPLPGSRVAAVRPRSASRSPSPRRARRPRRRDPAAMAGADVGLGVVWPADRRGSRSAGRGRRPGDRRPPHQRQTEQYVGNPARLVLGPPKSERGVRIVHMPDHVIDAMAVLLGTNPGTNPRDVVWTRADGQRSRGTRHSAHSARPRDPSGGTEGTAAPIGDAVPTQLTRRVA